MEQVLPRDMMNEILSKLNNHDLFQYSISCKIAHESADHIWGKRYYDIFPRLQRMIESHSLDLSELQLNENSKWYTKYTETIYFVLLKTLSKLMNQVNIHDNHNNSPLEKMLDIIHQTMDLMKQHQKFKNFLKIVEQKLSEFMFYGSFNRRQIANKYYPLLFRYIRLDIL
jgi:hypothetical protein